MTMPGYDEIAENLAVLDDWEERYAYVIQIGKALPPLPEELRTEANRVQGARARSGSRPTAARGPIRCSPSGATATH